MPSEKLPSWHEVYLKAKQENQQYYIDPDTGAYVFLEEAHLKRGWCCGSKCRHCPYHYINVDASKENK